MQILRRFLILFLIIFMISTQIDLQNSIVGTLWELLRNISQINQVLFIRRGFIASLDIDRIKLLWADQISRCLAIRRSIIWCVNRAPMILSQFMMILTFLTRLFSTV